MSCLQYGTITTRLYRLATGGNEEEHGQGYLRRISVLHKLGLGGERHFHQLSGAEGHLSESWKLARPVRKKSVSTSSAAVPSLRHVSGSWWRHGPQHARLPCPRLARVWANSCPLSQWCHRNISSSVVLFPFPPSFPVSGSLPMSWLFASGAQSIGASASFLLMDIQGWFPLGLTSVIFLLSKGLSTVFNSTV